MKLHPGGGWEVWSGLSRAVASERIGLESPPAAAPAAARARPRSLRGHLAWLLFPPLAAMLAVGATAAYYFGIAPATEAYDYGLIDAAHAIGSRIHQKEGQLLVDLPEIAEQVVRADKYDTVYFVVRDSNNVAIAGDGGIPLRPSGIEVRGNVALYDADYQGSRIRVAAVFLPCAGVTCSVSVAETTVKRETLQRDILLGSVLPQSLLALLTVALLWWGLTRGLKPLEVLSGEIRARSPHDLRPIDLAHEPEEVRPLLVALNQLFEGVAESNRTQQRFLANAAHQLRTPLAGLQAHSEIALAQQVPEACRAELEQIHLGTVRTARLANQLLAIARAERGAQRPEVLEAVDLKQAAEESADEWVHQALRRGLDLGFDLEQVHIMGEALLIREALANLVHNAVEYTLPGGRVTVRSGARCMRVEGRLEERAILEVEDDGAGIPAQERVRVFERFYRIQGTAGTGSGLGLAIVREIVLAHDGNIEIEDAAGSQHPRGCRVTLSFPLPPGAA